MKFDGFGNANTNSVEFSFDSDAPRKYHEEKTKNLKKNNKCVYIIVIISVIILLFVGIFLAIFFATKKKENGGEIFVTYKFNSTGKKELFYLENLDEDDYDIINYNEPNNRRILSGDKKYMRLISSTGEYNYTIKFTKILTSLKGMFANNNNLIYADFSHFVSKKIVNMNNLFFNCINLEKVNFDNFDSEKLETMDNCFEYCKELTKIDLSSFETPKLSSMNSAFKNCTNLLYLNIENFIIQAYVKHDNLLKGINNITRFEYPDNNDIIKNEIKEANFIFIDCKEDDWCNECSYSNDIYINVCVSCHNNFFLPKSDYPLKCHKCDEYLDKCESCENKLTCTNCKDGYIIEETKSSKVCTKEIIPSDSIDTTEPIDDNELI